MSGILHDTFTIERVYEKCRDHVWSRWSDRAKKNRWMGGGIERMEFAPGGRERSVFRDAMGEHVDETAYFDIVEGRRIVMAYVEQITVPPPSDGVPGRRHGWTALLNALDGVLDADLSPGWSR